jgi:hypothetical protein
MKDRAPGPAYRGAGTVPGEESKAVVEAPPFCGGGQAIFPLTCPAALRRTPRARSRNPAQHAGSSAQEAEGEGFEPSTDGTAGNGFRDRRIRPLCHPSARATAYRAFAKAFVYDSRPRRSGRVAEGGALLRR